MKLKDKGDIIIGNIETKEDYKIFNKDMRANAERFFFVEISFLKNGVILKKNIVGKYPT